MKNLSIQEFIKDVKIELKNSIDKEDPFFYMGEVELEIAFALDTQANAGGKFIVVDIGGKIKTTHTHKIKLKLIPFEKENINIESVNPYVVSRAPMVNTSSRAKVIIPGYTSPTAQVVIPVHTSPTAQAPTVRRISRGHTSPTVFTGRGITTAYTSHTEKTKEKK